MFCLAIITIVGADLKGDFFCIIKITNQLKLSPRNKTLIIIWLTIMIMAFVNEN